VAIVTTAGLQRPGDEAWRLDETAFRVFDRSERGLIVGNLSQNYDRSGASADLNVVYPLDRLEELAADGVIGEVAPRHISFAGTFSTMNGLETVMLDSGPAAAQLLRDDAVDVVLLTPV
jgi:D-proline reductase (dithiol) PrdB